MMDIMRELLKAAAEKRARDWFAGIGPDGDVWITGPEAEVREEASRHGLTVLPLSDVKPVTFTLEEDPVLEDDAKC